MIDLLLDVVNAFGGECETGASLSLCAVARVEGVLRNTHRHKQAATASNSHAHNLRLHTHTLNNSTYTQLLLLRHYHTTTICYTHTPGRVPFFLLFTCTHAQRKDNAYFFFLIND